MQVQLSSLDSNGDAASVAVALLAVPCFEDEYLESKVFVSLDKKLDGFLLRAVKDEQWKAKDGQSLSLHSHGKVAASRIVLFGLGARKDFDSKDLRTYGARVVKATQELSAGHAAAVVPAVDGDAAAHERAVQFLVEGTLHGSYRFDKYYTGEKKKPFTVQTVQLLVPSENGDAKRNERALKRAHVVAEAVQLARHFVNEPAAVATPTHIAAEATQLAHAKAAKGLSVEVLGPAECKKLGMGMFMGVAQGSDEEPRVVHLTLKPQGKPPGGAKKVIALIGKGVTFDSGGMSLKTSEGMLDMKIDMSGAATVISAMGALADLGCPYEVHAFTALCENMLSGKSYHLGDVLTSMNGKTVEINNTDAEGRLTLGDAITYAKQVCKPDEIYDFATLTGACMVALGPHIAGVMSNDAAVADRWLASAKNAGEEMWQLPLPKKLKEQLKSDIADMRNTGSRYGGALTAGLFLKEFVGDTPWVHVDLAGPASADKESGHLAAGGTGFAVATIVAHLVPQE